MVEPSIPENETARLAALKSYHILDTLPEEDYDSITILASQICGTSMSTVSLIDADRVFLKSHIGLEYSDGGERRTSFCAHAINQPDELLIIPDSRLDPRFCDNPAVVGEPHVVFYSGYPLITNDGFALGTLCVVDSKPHQITEGQKESLKILGKQVFRLLELRLANELLIAKQNQLEIYANDMEMFAYVASHDLKEPLRMVKSFNELLEKKYAGQLDETAQKYIKYSVDGTIRMNALIDDLLSYFTAGTLHSKYHSVNINEVIDDISQNYAEEISQNRMIFLIDKLPTVNVSKLALTQIFKNLIENAVKYKKKDTIPSIRITAEELATQWKFSVIDNGIGINSKYLNSIFKIFTRLHGKNEYSGTGIGLAIVKRIIDQSGGKIWATSIPNEGSAFHFTLDKVMETTSENKVS